jgi:hypothetical protein
MTILNKVSNKSLMTGVTPIADVPDAPTIGTATDVGTSRAYNNGAATVTYTAAATGGTATTFTATSTPGSFTATGASPVTVTGLQSATSYTFAVSAANAKGTLTSGSTSAITATTVPDAPVIGTPTVATGQSYTGNANVSVPFTAPATGGKAISTYTVTSSSGGTATGSSSPISISDAVGTARTYTVTATNANGTGNASSASASTTPLSVPQAPTIGTATDAGTGTSVTVAYTANATGGAAVSAYTATSSPGGFTGTGASPITVSGLTAGTAYTFTVTATNSQGTSSASSASNSVTPVVPSNFFLISTVAPSSSTTVTFSSIPSTYKLLQIRAINKDSSNYIGASTLKLNFNGDTGANYADHYLQGQGTSATAGNDTSSTFMTLYTGTAGNNAAMSNIFAGLILDIVDYTSTSKYKTVKGFGGVSTNNATPGTVGFDSGLWMNTAALTSMTFTSASGNFVAGTTFSLYGVS